MVRSTTVPVVQTNVEQCVSDHICVVGERVLRVRCLSGWRQKGWKECIQPEISYQVCAEHRQCTHRHCTHLVGYFWSSLEPAGVHASSLRHTSTYIHTYLHTLAWQDVSRAARGALGTGQKVHVVPPTYPHLFTHTHPAGCFRSGPRDPQGRAAGACCGASAPPRR